jgi:hypothetical protein
MDFISGNYLVVFGKDLMSFWQRLNEFLPKTPSIQLESSWVLDDSLLHQLLIARCLKNN